MRADPLALMLTVIINLLIILAGMMVIVTTVRFFGALSAHPAGQIIVELGSMITIPFGINLTKTPFGGVFDANTALTAGSFLLAEWVINGLRSRL